MQACNNFAQSEWANAQTVWAQFCKANPDLGLKGTRSSWVWFRRAHGSEMIKLGVMRQSVSKALLIHVPSFAPAAFAYLTTPPEVAA